MNLADFAFTDAPTRAPRPAKALRQQRPFLRGPVPLGWLQQAGALPGRALHVGVALWFLVGVTKSMTVRLAPKVTRDLGADRNAVYRSVRLLENAGLITVVRRRGKSPLVTVRTE